MGTKAQEEAIARIVGKVRAKFGEEAALTFGAASTAHYDVVPSGIEVLDHHLTGIGGFPRGRVAEVFGDEGCGKTSLAYAIAAYNQKLGGVVSWHDSEHSFDVSRFKVFGGDPKSIVLETPNNLEEAIDGMRTTAEASAIDDKLLIIWDSIASSPTQEELEKMASEEVSMRRGGMIGRACRAIGNVAAKKKIIVLFVNQVREKIGMAFGDPFVTPGGKGPKFLASIRIHIMGGQAVKDGAVFTGKDLLFKAKKNRFSPPHREARVRLDYQKGWDTDWSTLNHAKDLELLKAATPFTEKNVEKARELLKWPGAK